MYDMDKMTHEKCTLWYEVIPYEKQSYEPFSIYMKSTAHNWNLVKILLNAFISIIIQSDHKFAHVMTAQLSWHVQNCVLINWLFIKSIIDFFYKIWIASSYTFWWNRPQVINSTSWQTLGNDKHIDRVGNVAHIRLKNINTNLINMFYITIKWLHIL